MNPPLGPQDSNDVAANTKLAFVDDNARDRGDNASAQRREDIYAFVNTRGSPWLVPERLWVPVFDGCSSDGNRRFLRNRKTGAKQYSQGSKDSVKATTLHLL